MKSLLAVGLYLVACNSHLLKLSEKWNLFGPLKFKFVFFIACLFPFYCSVFLSFYFHFIALWWTVNFTFNNGKLASLLINFFTINFTLIWRLYL